VGKKSFGVLSVLVLVFSMLAPFAAAAEEVTRESYKAAVEPICKANVQTNERLLKHVRAEVKAGKLKSAATQFTKAAAALKRALKELKAVPQPPADKARLAKWFKNIGEEEGFFVQIAKKLKAGDKNGATAMQIRLSHTANVANNQVLAFEFKYCRVDPSKFT
jgi:GH24 family phage-related lysozyme (muramidase)